MSRTLPYPLNAVNGGENVNNVFRKQMRKTQNFKSQQPIDVGLNLSDYKFRQEHKGKYEKKASLLRAPRLPSRAPRLPLSTCTFQRELTTLTKSGARDELSYECL